MALKDALEAQRTQKVKGPACSVCALLAALPPDESSALADALADFGYTGEAISRALESEGHRIAGQTIQRHRRRKCYGTV